MQSVCRRLKAEASVAAAPGVGGRKAYVEVEEQAGAGRPSSPCRQSGILKQGSNMTEFVLGGDHSACCVEN